MAPLGPGPSAHPRAPGFIKDSLSRGTLLKLLPTNHLIEMTTSAQSSVHTLTLPVSLHHWIQCHFLYSVYVYAKKSEIRYCCLIVAKMNKNNLLQLLALQTWIQHVRTHPRGCSSFLTWSLEKEYLKQPAASSLELKAPFPEHRRSPHCQSPPSFS